MPNTIITIVSSDNGDIPRLKFQSDGNFGLGTDFPNSYKERMFDSLNFESISMTTDGELVEITNTSGKAFQFRAMPLASMTGVETAVVTAFGEDVLLGAGTQADWTLQLYTNIMAHLNNRR